MHKCAPVCALLRARCPLHSGAATNNSRWQARPVGVLIPTELVLSHAPTTQPEGTCHEDERDRQARAALHWLAISAATSGRIHGPRGRGVAWPLARQHVC